MPDILEQIARAIATATNDDLSELGSEKRARHIERLETMDAARTEIERLRGAIKDCSDGGPCAKIVFKSH